MNSNILLPQPHHPLPARIKDNLIPGVSPLRLNAVPPNLYAFPPNPYAAPPNPLPRTTHLIQTNQHYPPRQPPPCTDDDAQWHVHVHQLNTIPAPLPIWTYNDPHHNLLQPPGTQAHADIPHPQAWQRRDLGLGTTTEYSFSEADHPAATQARVDAKGAKRRRMVERWVEDVERWRVREREEGIARRKALGDGGRVREGGLGNYWPGQQRGYSSDQPGIAAGRIVRVQRGEGKVGAGTRDDPMVID